MPSDAALKAAREFMDGDGDGLAALLDSFAAREREACAKLCEKMSGGHAAAIRARGGSK